jgi:hypothetical protein
MKRLVLLVLLAACGGSTSVPDAAPPIPGVACGDDFCDPSISAGCCVTTNAAPVCALADGYCVGQLTDCDGPEDCEQVCCGYSGGASCTAEVDCVPSRGGTPLCHGPC